MLSLILRDKFLYRITVWVFCVHLALLVLLLLSGLWTTSITPPKKKMVVQTVSLKKTTEIATTTQKPKVAAAKEVKTSPPSKKKEIKKPAPSKKKEVKKAPPSKEKEVIESKSLAKAKEKLAKIKDSASKELIALSTLTIGEEDYRDNLVSCLQEALQLPERGSVKLKLTLDRFGKILKLEILTSNSQRNQTYVETTLPLLHFPPFDKHFSSLTKYTFPITLTSD